ncbi:imm11 family protein [Pyxidicoccus sp. 3LG]
MRFFQLETLGDLNDWDLVRLDGPPEGMKMRSYTLARGKPATPHFPKPARVVLAEEYPGIKLSTLLGNAHNHLVVHADMKAVIAEHCQDLEVEYLPFDLYDHRKRLYSRDYFFINPLGSRDCLDPKASKVEIGPEGGVIQMGASVLDPKKADALPALFRVQEDPSTYIVSQALAEALKAKAFTNVQLDPLDFSTSA